jgi:large subunit ribosomal protein L29
MTTAEIRELTTEELVDALTEAKEEKFNLRFQVATNQLDNTARIRVVKTDDAHVGDTVQIVETRPISKQKRWRLTEIVERAR